MNNLQLERKENKLDIQQIGEIFWGSKQFLDEYRKWQKVIENDPILKHSYDNYGLSRQEQIKNSVKVSKRFTQVFKLQANDYEKAMMIWGTIIVLQFSHMQIAASLSYTMFVPLINHVGTEKQIKKWAEPAERTEIIGCYAQTELSHGSDLQSLQTTAHFDKQTQEFIIDNSKDIKHMKYWPGDLGLSCTHIAIMANLIIDDFSYGPQPFIVPVRDPQTFELYPGIEAGDIGSKFGYASKDNGYMILTNYRIPKANMLCKYAKVSKDGDLEIRGNPKVAYVSMMGVRMWIITSSINILSKAVTSAARYSIQRTQFSDSNKKEITTMDYQLQQEKIINCLADTYVLKSSSLSIYDVFKSTLEKLNKQDHSQFKDLHQLASCAKSFFTDRMCHGLEVCRRACGGHGILDQARFHEAYVESTPMATYEGENTILYLQTAQVLIKALNKYQQGDKQSSDQLAYIQQLSTIKEDKYKIHEIKDFTRDMNIIQELLKFITILQIKQADYKIQEGIKQGMKFKESFNQHACIDLVLAAKYHIQYYSYSQFQIKLIQNQQKYSHHNTEALQNLGLIFGLRIVLENLNILIANDIVLQFQIDLLSDSYQKLLRYLRKDIVGLTDGFFHNDNSLGTLGQYEGNVYENIFKVAKENNSINKYRQELQKDIRDKLLNRL